MKTKSKSTIRTRCHSCGVVCAVAIVLQFGVLAGYAQTGDYLYSGSKTTITLNLGLYAITAYGAQGGGCYQSGGGLGAEMEGEFDFMTATTLTLLVGGVGGNGSGQFGPGGGGGGGSFVVNGSTPLVVAGGGGGGGAAGSAAGNTGTSGGSGGYAGGGGGINGGGGQGSGLTGGGGGFSSGGGGINGSSFLSGGAGGGSIIDSSAIMVLAEVSGIASPDGSPNGEIIITAVPEPTSLALAGLSGLSLLLFRRQRK
jgi:hypothetical protein